MPLARRRTSLALTLALCARCAPALSPDASNAGPDATASDGAIDEQSAGSDDAGTRADAPLGGARFLPEHTFPTIEVPPGGELLTLCQSWTLNNDEDLWVNAVTMDAGPGWHHSNWVFVRDSTYPGPDGTWPCDERDFSEAVAGALGGVFFAQSTQATHEVQRFPPGVAYRIPRRVKVIGSVHLINPSAATLRSSIGFRIEAIPSSAVQTRLRPLAIDNRAIRLAPRARTAVTTACDLRTGYEQLTHHGLDFSVYYVLPHYHAYGRSLRLSVVGGARDGQTVFETLASVGDPLGGMLPTPFDLSGADGLRVTCTYQNSSDREIRWGVHAADEMCTMLVYTSAVATFGGAADEIASQESAPDGTTTIEAPCDLRTLASQ